MCEDFFPEFENAPPGEQNFADEFDDDGELAADDQQKQDLATLANRQLAIEARIKDIEEQLSKAKRELFSVSSEDIPRLMDEIGMKEFMLTSGERIQVKRGVKASIPVKFRDQAFAWLRENGHGDLVKNEVKATFGRGEDERARALLKFLQDKGLNADQKESVHAGTLAAFVREQLERGAEVPHEMLGVFEYQETKVTKA